MLDLDGHARLIDFGLSKLNVTDDISTFTKTLCGTNCYMAPEVVREKGETMFFVKLISFVLVNSKFSRNYRILWKIGGLVVIWSISL